jgi:L-ascorbate metabolism protein UlaG (beta-lactamase superfamily)
MKIQCIRHATCLIIYGGRRLLLDPVLSAAGTLNPVPEVPNQSGNPLVPLPELEVILLEKTLDAILVTHTHRDHFDEAARHRLPKGIPLFCQPPDLASFQEAGFRDVRPITDRLYWGPITLIRTGGQHGTGAIGQRMAPVSGFILVAGPEPTLYITGDTIWCAEVREALQTHSPEVVLAYAGEARFAIGDPITMTTSDLKQLTSLAPTARIIAVHMEAWNHCRLTRNELRKFRDDENLGGRLWIPENGEWLNFEKNRERPGPFPILGSPDSSVPVPAPRTGRPSGPAGHRSTSLRRRTRAAESTPDPNAPPSGSHYRTPDKPDRE